MPVEGGVIHRPVIAERGLSGASHLLGLTVEGKIQLEHGAR